MQRLPIKRLQIIYQALIISRQFYTLAACVYYLSAELTDGIDAFLKDHINMAQRQPS
jgi:hypothetical protein